jgi:hypothetical protein
LKANNQRDDRRDKENSNLERSNQYLHNTYNDKVNNTSERKSLIPLRDNLNLQNIKKGLFADDRYGHVKMNYEDKNCKGVSESTKKRIA